ncbi:hypothetical protein CKA32_004636 [Geitlerinema sp. FC II]|nr:hypothetical protein CKA32_004636 [Geitlerinema sp. FC II]
MCDRGDVRWKENCPVSAFWAIAPSTLSRVVDDKTAISV